GVFSAAYFLCKEGDLPQYERDNLEKLLAWFESELTIPPAGTVHPQAIFWYKTPSPFVQRMWELVEIIREHGFTAELITANFIGRVVYEDRYQYAAIPGKRHRRLN